MTLLPATLDLRGEACPMTFVRTELALEGLSPGAVLEVILDAGEPAESVPRSVALRGNEILDATPAGAAVRVRIRKR